METTLKQYRPLFHMGWAIISNAQKMIKTEGT